MGRVAMTACGAASTAAMMGDGVSEYKGNIKYEGGSDDRAAVTMRLQ